MSHTTKRYKLNKDFSIDCETRVLPSGDKQYSVRVIFTGSTFEDILERLEGCLDKDKANNFFLYCRDKYKEGISSFS